MLIQSRKHLKKIGDVLRQENLDSQEFLDAYDGLSAFRALHLPAMQRVNIRCRQVIKKHPLLDLDRVIIAQRGKRLESVIRKLQRFEGMQLDRMQDVGGVRVIFDTLEEVNSFTTHFPSKSKIELERKYDYIHTPKEDGYRGIHLILGLENHDKTLCSFDKLTVELQVRTKLQHYWATAVEMAGIINQHSYKTGDWDEEWKAFFVLVGECFAYKEREKILSTQERKEFKLKAIELFEKEARLDVLNIFINLSFVIEMPNQQLNRTYSAILDLSSKYKSVEMTAGLSNLNSPLLLTIYKKKELEYQKTKTGHILFIDRIKATNFKKAYPNFFMDTSDFVKTLNEIKKSVLS